MSKTLEVIIAELHRQAAESRSRGIGWLDTDDPADATIDGQVNLVDLANAIDSASQEPKP